MLFEHASEMSKLRERSLCGGELIEAARGRGDCLAEDSSEGVKAGMIPPSPSSAQRRTADFISVSSRRSSRSRQRPLP